MKDAVEKLRNDYQQERNISVESKLFKHIFLMFPALMVCMADNQLDPEEEQGLNYISDELAQELEEFLERYLPREQIRSILMKEYLYLCNDLETWQDRFLETVKEFLTEEPSEKEFVHETMHLLANIADGISNVEQEVIDDLSEKLALVH